MADPRTPSRPAAERRHEARRVHPSRRQFRQDLFGDEPDVDQRESRERRRLLDRREVGPVAP